MRDPRGLMVEMARACNHCVVAALKAKDWAMVISYQDDRDHFMAMARR